MLLGSLPEQALQQGSSRTAVGKMSFLVTEEAPYRPPVLPPVVVSKVLRVLLTIVLLLLLLLWPV